MTNPSRGAWWQSKDHRWVEVVFLLVVLGIAAYLRLGFSGVYEFKRDEANLSILALDLVRGRSFPLLGIASSVGFPNAPFNVYVLAIPYFFTSDPIVATQFIGLLNVLAVAMTYVFMRRYVNPFVALIATLLFAVSPWSVVFSRKIWAQNMLPLFVVATTLTGVIGLADKKKWAQVAHPALLAITGQIHYGAFVIIPAVLWLWIVYRRNVTRYFWVGWAVAIVLTLPYITGLAQGGFLDLSRLPKVQSVVTEAETVPSSLLRWNALRETFVLFSGIEIHSLAGPIEFQNYLAQLPFSPQIFLMLGGVVALSSGWLLYRVLFVRYPRRAIDAGLLIWLLLPIVSYTINWTEFYIHYLIPSLPAGFLIIALAVSDVSSLTTGVLNANQTRILRGGVGGGALALSLLQLISVVVLFNFLWNTYTPNGFGQPLGRLQPLREYVLQSSADYVIGKSTGQAIRFDDDATVLYALLYDAPFIRFEDENTMVYQPGGLNLVIDADCNVACKSDNGHIFSLRSADEGCYTVYERDYSDLVSVEMIPVANGAFQNHLVVDAFYWNDADNSLDLLWRVDAIPEDKRDYFFAVHAFDNQGQRVAIADDLSWFTSYWLPDTRVLERFFIGHPVDYIQIGLYILDSDGDFHNILRVDDQSFLRLDMISHSQ